MIADSRPPMAESRKMRSRRRVLWATAFSVCWFALLVAAGLAWDRAFPWIRFYTPYREGVPDVDREWYLSSDRDVLDYDVLYQGWWGTPAALQQADVLFMGNSRAVFGFRPEYFQPYLDPIGLRGYNLSFAGGSDFFPRDIVRKYDLHPKLIIVNSDFFFAGTLQRFGVWATERSAWESFRMYHEYVASWAARKHLHLWCPPWREYMTANPYQVWYRSVSTGGTRWPVAQEQRNPITRTRPLPLTPAEQAIVDGLYPRELEYLLAFRDEMAARGALLVLTVVPYQEHLTFHLTTRLAAETGVPFIDEWPIGLEGQRGSHMNAASAKRFLDGLMPRVIADPKVRAHLGLGAGAPR